MIQVRLAATLRDWTGGPAEFELEPDSLNAIMSHIRGTNPAVYSAIFDETGRLRRHVNVFINNVPVTSRELGGMNQKLQRGDTLFVFPAVSGG